MVRVVLFFLTLPSLLTPSGVCICQRITEESVPPVWGTVAVAVPTERPNGHPPHAGCCKNCRLLASHATEPQSAVASGMNGPTSHPPSEPDHPPTCPAAGLTTTAKYVQPPALLLDLLFIDCDSPVDLVTQPLTHRGFVADLTPRTPTPRYISFCVLLI